MRGEFEGERIERIVVPRVRGCVQSGSGLARV